MRLLRNLFLLAILGVAISFFAAPGVAFYGIRAAADAGDLVGLARLLDTGAVRGSLRSQLAGRPQDQTPSPSFLEDPIGAVRRQIDDIGRPAGPSADSYMTAQALGALTRGEGWDSSEDGVAVSAAPPRNPIPLPVFWSLNRARLAVKGVDGERTVFTFERKGPFEWKLVHIGLPERLEESTRP